MKIQKKSPKVSVCVVTYNQEKYIRQCLQSIVDQQTNFNFDVIVSDDCSTDGTGSIIREFFEKYPELIKPIFHEKNIGPYENYIYVHGQATGEYIAHIDGDDFAFPSKLEVQTKFLDENKMHVVVWHRMETFNDEGTLKSVGFQRLEEVVDVLNIKQEDLLRFGTLGFHSSIMYRSSCRFSKNGPVPKFLDYYAAVGFLDFGKAANLSQVLGGYRFNFTQSTASKKRFMGMSFSSVRSLYLSHLIFFLKKYPHFRGAIFSNSLFNAMTDLIRLRPTVFGFAFLAARSFCLNEVFDFRSHVSKVLKLRLF